MKILIYILVTSLFLLQTSIPFSNNVFSYALVSSCVLWFVIGSGKKRFDWKYILLVTAIIISLLVNKIPSIFDSNIRSLTYLLLLLFASNIIYNRRILIFRSTFLSAFYFIGASLILVNVISVILGFFPIINPNETHGGFSGFFNNSIGLAAIAGLICIMSLYKTLSAEKSMHKRMNLFIFLLTLFILIITGSRSGLAATIIAIAYFLWKLYGSKKLLKRYWLVFVMIGTGISYGIQNNWFTVIQNKQEGQEILGQNSRTVMWNNRIYEFEQNPIFGIGFAAIDLDHSTAGLKESGGVEPGSSWLFIASTLGLFGILIFILIIYGGIKRLLKRGTPSFYMVNALIIFYLIHMIFEGYIFSTGNIMVYVFYVSLSLTSNYFSYASTR